MSRVCSRIHVYELATDGLRAADKVGATLERSPLSNSMSTGREVKSAARTIDVLELLASRQGAPTRLVDVATQLGMPRSSTHALMRTLVDTGWVQTDRSGTLFSIGIHVLTTGTSFLDSDPRVRIVRPVLLELTRTLGETFHLARMDQTDVVYLATQESTKETRSVARVGRRLPLWACSLGKAILAARDDIELPELTPVTPKTITDLDRLNADLEVTRRRGYAIDDEENTIGVQCFGFALKYTAPVCDAISCSMPKSRLTQQLAAEIVSALSSACERIELMAPAPR